MTISKLKMISPQQKNGAIYEQIACEYLQSQRLLLIAQNWLQPKVGEIDLIMIESGATWDTVIFIEVRSRKSGKYGDAVASVTKAKQKKLIKTARFFLQAHPHLQNHECRFDVFAFSQQISNSVLNQSKHKGNQINLSLNQAIPHTLSKDNLPSPHISSETSFEWIQGAFVATAWA